MKKLLQAIASNRADTAIILGGVFIAVGVGMIYVPAGLIAAGIMTIIFAVASTAGGGDGE